MRPVPLGEKDEQTEIPAPVEELTSKQTGSGVEVESVSDASDPPGPIHEPFDPEKIDVKTKPMVVDLIMARVRGGTREIDLLPDFQRRAGIWDQQRKSRLIESLLLRIPLPVFYVAANQDERWSVVDGLQRIQTLKEFIVDKTLILNGMEFLVDLNGKDFDDLPRPMQRRINESEIVVHIIQPGTPDDVMFNIFKRINTGGLPLSAQEIRHAIKQGRSTEFIKELAESTEFKSATGYSIKDERMADRECVLRFCAFSIYSPEAYSGDMDNLLINTLDTMNQWDVAKERKITGEFKSAMVAASAIFEEWAFRKYNGYKGPGGRLSPINKALFEVWAVNLSKLTPRQIAKLIRNKDVLLQGFAKLMRSPRFVESISVGTGAVAKVQKRFSLVNNLINETLDV